MARALKIFRKLILQLIMAYIVVFVWAYLFFLIPPANWPIDLHWLVIAITIVLGLMTTLLQIRNYKGIALVDFLESRHKITLDKNVVTKEDFLELLANQFIEYKLFNHDENEVIVRVEHSFFKMESAIIRFKVGEENNILSIERSRLDGFPDNAKNYKMLQRIAALLNGNAIVTR